MSIAWAKTDLSGEMYRSKLSKSHNKTHQVFIETLYKTISSLLYEYQLPIYYMPASILITCICTKRA